MKISAVLGFNLIDYPGRIAAVAFAPGCNYACPHCHAKPLLGDAQDIGQEEFFRYLGTVRNWITGVVVCGGEPTLQPGLPDFLARLKSENFAVKLDTNGSSPEVLERLLSGKLVDYVAVDVKGPRHLLGRLAGRGADAGAVEKSLRLAAMFPDCEFRTTAAPVVRENGEISFMTVGEVAEAARQLRDAAGPDVRYFVQKFVPRKDGLLDPRLETFPETPAGLLSEMRDEAAKYLPKTAVRG